MIKAEPNMEDELADKKILKSTLDKRSLVGKTLPVLVFFGLLFLLTPEPTYALMNISNIDSIIPRREFMSLYGELNIVSKSGSPDIASLGTTQIKFYQPLSVRVPGGLSVSNGIDLTDPTSSIIESYSTLYIKTSAGAPTDIVFQPTGIIGFESDLNIGGNKMCLNSACTSYVHYNGTHTIIT